MTKEQVIISVHELPEFFEPEQLIERIIALQKMEEGLEQIDKGEVVTVEQARQCLSPWLR